MQIYKAKFLMTLAVDGRTAPVYLLKNRGSSQTNTKNPLYLGGVPDDFDTSVLKTQGTQLLLSFYLITINTSIHLTSFLILMSQTCIYISEYSTDPFMLKPIENNNILKFFLFQSALLVVFVRFDSVQRVLASASEWCCRRCKSSEMLANRLVLSTDLYFIYDHCHNHALFCSFSQTCDVSSFILLCVAYRISQHYIHFIYIVDRIDSPIACCSLS